MLLFHHLAREGASPETIPEAERRKGEVPENRHSPFRADTGQPASAGAAPADGARTPALGRSWPSRPLAL